MNRRLALPYLALLAGCNAPPDPTPPPAEPPPFRFETTGADVVDLRVTAAQQPLPRVFVTIRAAQAPAEDGVTIAGDVLFQGLTDGEGRCQGRLTRPTALERLQVTLQAPGHEGRYDDPRYRQAYGPAAPAAWFTVSPAELADTRVDLSPTEAP